jgi:hypothetical protein
MVVNRLQKGLVNSRITSRASRLSCQFFFFKFEHIFFSDRDFYSENNNVSQVYTYKPKISKKKSKKKTTLLSSMLKLRSLLR